MFEINIEYLYKDYFKKINAILLKEYEFEKERLKYIKVKHIILLNMKQELIYL